MENFSQLFAVLTRADLATLPAVKQLCDAILEDPVASRIPDDQLLCLIKYFCAAEAQNLDFVLSWILSALVARNDVRKLIAIVYSLIDRRISSGNYLTVAGLKCYGMWASDELRMLGFNSIAFSSRTKEAFARANEALRAYGQTIDESFTETKERMITVPVAEAYVALAKQAEFVASSLSLEKWTAMSGTVYTFFEDLNRHMPLDLSKEVVYNLAMEALRNWGSSTISDMTWIWRWVARGQDTAVVDRLLEKAAIDPLIIKPYLNIFVGNVVAVYPEAKGLWILLEGMVSELDFTITGDYQVILEKIRICQMIVGAKKLVDSRNLSDNFVSISLIEKLLQANVSIEPLVTPINQLFEELVSGTAPCIYDRARVGLWLLQRRALPVRFDVASRLARLLGTYVNDRQFCLTFFDNVLAEVMELTLPIDRIVRNFWFGNVLPAIFYKTCMEDRLSIFKKWRDSVCSTDWVNAPSTTLGCSLPYLLSFLIYPFVNIQSRPTFADHDYDALSFSQSQASGVEPLTSSVLRGIITWLSHITSSSGEEPCFDSADVHVFLMYTNLIKGNFGALVHGESVVLKALFMPVGDGTIIKELMTVQGLNSRLVFACLLVPLLDFASSFKGHMLGEDSAVNLIQDCMHYVRDVVLKHRTDKLVASTGAPAEECRKLVEFTELDQIAVMECIDLLFISSQQRSTNGAGDNTYEAYDMWTDGSYESSSEGDEDESSKNDESDDSQENEDSDDDLEDEDGTLNPQRGKSLQKLFESGIFESMLNAENKTELGCARQVVHALRKVIKRILSDQHVSTVAKKKLADDTVLMSMDFRFRDLLGFIFNEYDDFVSIEPMNISLARLNSFLDSLKTDEQLRTAATMSSFMSYVFEILEGSSMQNLVLILPNFCRLLRAFANSDQGAREVHIEDFLFQSLRAIDKIIQDRPELADSVHKYLIGDSGWFKVDIFFPILSELSSETDVAVLARFMTCDEICASLAKIVVPIEGTSLCTFRLLEAALKTSKDNSEAHRKIFSVTTLLLNLTLKECSSEDKEDFLIECGPFLCTLVFGSQGEKTGSTDASVQLQDEPQSLTNRVLAFKELARQDNGTDDRNGRVKRRVSEVRSPSPNGTGNVDGGAAGALGTFPDAPSRRKRLLSFGMAPRALAEGVTGDDLNLGGFRAAILARLNDGVANNATSHTAEEKDNQEEDSDDDSDHNERDDHNADPSASARNVRSEELESSDSDSDFEIVSDRARKILRTSVPQQSTTVLNRDTNSYDTVELGIVAKLPVTERFMLNDSLQSLIPFSQRCLRDSMEQRPMFRCHTCSNSATYSPLCSACVTVCHDSHSISFDGFSKRSCSCSPEKCEIACRALSSNTDPGPLQVKKITPPLLRSERPAPYLVDLLFDPATVSLLSQAYLEVVENASEVDETSTSTMAAAKISDRHLLQRFQPMPSTGGHTYSEPYDVWKGVDAFKQVQEHMLKFSVTPHRLASNQRFVALAEGIHVTLLNPGALTCCVHRLDNSMFPPTSTFSSVTQANMEELSSTEVGFAVVHLEFNPCNPLLLLASGMGSCCVLAMTQSGTVAKKIVMTTAIDINDPVRRILWLPNSKTEFVLVSGLHVRLYDLARKESPICSYKLAEEMMPIADAVFSPSQPHLLLLLSSSGCVLFQDLTVRDEVDELLLCEFLSPPLGDTKTAVNISIVEATSLLIHFASGAITQLVLDERCTRVILQYVIDDDEPGSGRGTGPSLVLDNKYFITSTTRTMRSRGSLTVYEMIKDANAGNHRIISMPSRVLGQIQISVGRIAGLTTWGPSDAVRILALFENGSLGAFWHEPSLSPITQNVQNRKDIALAFGDLIRLVPLTDNSPLTINEVGCAKTHESSALYKRSLVFGARNGVVQVKESSSLITLMSETNLKQHMDPSYISAITCDSGPFDFYVGLSSPIHVIAGLRLFFGRLSDASDIPHMVALGQRQITLSADNFRPCPPGLKASEWSPVVVDIVLTEDELREAQQTAAVHVSLAKVGGATPMIAIDGVEIFVRDASQKSQTSLDSSHHSDRIEAETVTLLSSFARLFASSRWCDLPKAHADAVAQVMARLSRTKRSAQLFPIVLPKIFPNQYEQMKAMDILRIDHFCRDQIEDILSISVGDIRSLGRACLRFPLAAKRLLNSVAIKLSKVAIGLEDHIFGLVESGVPAKDLVLSLVSITLGVAEASGSAALFISTLHRLFGHISTGAATCDALLGFLAMRWPLFKDHDATLETMQAEHTMCDCCYRAPIQEILWKCSSCEGFDCCEHCFFASAFNGHDALHVFTKEELPVTLVSSCHICGDVAAEANATLCGVCGFLGFGGWDAAKGSRRHDRHSLFGSQHLLIQEIIRALPANLTPPLVRFVSLASVLSSKARHESSFELLNAISLKLTESLKTTIKSGPLEEQVLAFRYVTYLVRVTAQVVPMCPEKGAIAAGLEGTCLMVALRALERATAGGRSAVTSKGRPLPSWFGENHIESFKRWRDFAWHSETFEAVLEDRSLTLASIEDLALDRTTALNWLGSSESLLRAALDLRVALFALRGSESTATNAKEVECWSRLFSQAHAKMMRESTLRVLGRVISSLGISKPLSRLLLEAEFRSSLQQLDAIAKSVFGAPGEGSAVNLLSRIKQSRSTAFLLKKLSSSISKNVAAWQDFVRSASKSETNVVKILVDVASKISLVSEHVSPMPLKLIVKSLNSASSNMFLVGVMDRCTFMTLLTWLRSPLGSVRIHCLAILTVYLKQLTSLTSINKPFVERQYSLAVAMCLGSFKKQERYQKMSILDVERFILVGVIDASKCGWGDMNDSRVAFAVDTVLEELAWRVDTLTVKKRQMIPETLSMLIRAATPDAVESRIIRWRLNGTSGDIGELNQPGSGSDVASLQQAKDCLEVFDSSPCVHCNRPWRPFSVTGMDSSKSQITYMSSCVVFRLKQLVDVRQIILEIQPARRGATHMIDAVEVGIMSSYVDEQVDLQSLAVDESLWETAAVLTNFESAKSNPGASSGFVGGLSGMQGFGLASSSTAASSSNPPKLLATASICPPAQATFIKFKFVLSKERGDADRLLCPRCSKPVLNDHGVCSNCSETVFQCRQCRNINYEDLRSFLCVQCGFCRHFRFTFKMEARASSFFPPIKSEKEFETAIRLSNSHLSSLVAIESQLVDDRERTLEAYAALDWSELQKQLYDNDANMSACTAKLAKESVCALRARMVEYRRSGGVARLRDAVNATVRPRQLIDAASVEDMTSHWCSTCDMSIISALAACLSSLAKIHGVAGKIAGSKDHVAMLFRLFSLQMDFSKIKGLQLVMARSLVPDLEYSPLHVIALEKTSVGIARVIKLMRGKIELATERYVNVEEALKAIEFLTNLAYRSRKGKSLGEACITALNLPLVKAAGEASLSPELEQLASSALSSLIYLSSGSTDKQRTKLAKDSPAGGPSLRTLVNGSGGPRVKRARGAHESL